MRDTKDPKSQVTRLVPVQVQRHMEDAARSSVPTAIVRGSNCAIQYANPAFAQFLGYSSEQLADAELESVSREPERMEALIQRAWQSGCTELAPDLQYASHASGATCFGATLVQPLLDGIEPSALVQVVDTTLLAQSRGEAAEGALELRRANERLLLASLREHELAERAATANREVERLLQRKSVLAEVNAILSSSLELGETLSRVASLSLPDLADCCVVQLIVDGAPGAMAVAHRDQAVDKQLQGCPHEVARDPDLTIMTTAVLHSGQPFTRSLLDNPLLAGAMAATLARPLRDAGARAALAVPLYARARVIGVLTLFACSEERVQQPPNVESALELGRRASVAIDNAQLYGEAKRAVQLRDDVLAIVSHDLRNPLGAITMSVKRLLDQQPPGDHDFGRGLALIQRSSRHMRRLIEELLEVANIQKGQLVLQRAEVRLHPVIGEALEMFESAANQKGVRLVPHGQSELVLTCDSDRILRVVANLVGNAVKFTPAGGEVAVTSERVGEDVVVRVRDDGPGVPETERLKLFDQYWKGSRTGRTGMGLGLYIARSIVEAHGGRIWVESQPAGGSTFVFTVPQSHTS